MESRIHLLALFFTASILAVSINAAADPIRVASEPLAFDSGRGVATEAPNGTVFAWTSGPDLEMLHMEVRSDFNTLRRAEIDVPCRWPIGIAAHDETLLLLCLRYTLLEVIVLDEDLTLKTEPILLGEGTITGSTAWDGSAFLVVYSDSQTLFQVRISSHGTILDGPSELVDPIPPPEGTRSAQQYPELVTVGDEIFLIWQEGEAYLGVCSILCPVPARDGIIRFGRWQHGALPPETLVTLDPEEGRLFAPAAAWNGKRLLLSWYRQYEDTSVEIYSLDLDGPLEHVASFPDEMPPVSTQAEIEVAAVGDRFVVVWDAAGTSPTGIRELWRRDIRGTVVVDGAAGAKFAITSTDEHEWWPHIQPTESGFYLMFVRDPDQVYTNSILLRQTWRVEPSEPWRRGVRRR